jgi:hypothetical protein
MKVCVGVSKLQRPLPYVIGILQHESYKLTVALTVAEYDL